MSDGAGLRDAFGASGAPGSGTPSAPGSGTPIAPGSGTPSAPGDGAPGAASTFPNHFKWEVGDIVEWLLDPEQSARLRRAGASLGKAAEQNEIELEGLDLECCRVSYIAKVLESCSVANSTIIATDMIRGSLCCCSVLGISIFSF